jgi:polyvinyl alcohol dehydrogenase (cytochrome)
MKPSSSMQVSCLRLWLAFGVLAIGALCLPVLAGASPPASWPSGGHDTSNTHSNAAEKKIQPKNAGKLGVKWTYGTHGDVSAIPAVVGGSVYFPDWGGYLNKVNASTAAQVWSRPFSDYTGVPGDVARAAPAVVGNTVYVGDQGTQPGSVNGGWLAAVNATTGDPIWATHVDPHPNAILTAGPLVYDGVVYQGVASSEEAAAANPAYPCCTFRGSIVAVDAMTGGILWKTYMTPTNNGQPCATPPTGCGYSGAAIWGTTPAIDPATNTLFVTTGNNYTVPDAVTQCEANGGSAGQCLSPDDHVDSVLALDASTGQIKWATSVQGFDYGNAGPGFDFGSGPNLFTINDRKKGNNLVGGAGKKTKKLVVGAGQKSGKYWTLDAATGQVLWSTEAGPGSRLGGILWGSATDGKRIYIAEANFNGTEFELPSGQTTTHGSWAALDPATGKILWQTPDPFNNTTIGAGQALGPVTVANGVLYAPSMSGHLYALDAANGHFLWDYPAPGAAIGGAAVVDGTVYWGDGYTHLSVPAWLGSTTFYAFSVNGD